MVKKKPQKPKGLIVPKRAPGKAIKTNFMQNLREFPSQTHPVDDLLFPKTETGEENTGHSSTDKLDTQLININAPNLNTGHPAASKLDTQTPQPGHPESKNLSAEAPSNSNWTPSEEALLDTQTPKLEDAGHSRNENWKKWDAARSTVRVNLHIDKEVDRKVRQYCLIDAKPRVELKEFYERAAIDLLTKLDTQEAEPLGAGTPYDDRRLRFIWKCRPTLINLYLTYNLIFNEKSKWTARDDDAASKFNDVDIRIIELGIIQTQGNKGFTGKVNSFSYYAHEIEALLEMKLPDTSIALMLEINRQRWAKATGKSIDLSFLNQTDE